MAFKLMVACDGKDCDVEGKANATLSGDNLKVSLPKGWTVKMVYPENMEERREEFFCCSCSDNGKYRSIGRDDNGGCKNPLIFDQFAIMRIAKDIFMILEIFPSRMFVPGDVEFRNWEESGDMVGMSVVWVGGKDSLRKAGEEIHISRFMSHFIEKFLNKIKDS